MKKIVILITVLILLAIIGVYFFILPHKSFEETAEPFPIEKIIIKDETQPADNQQESSSQDSLKKQPKKAENTKTETVQASKPSFRLGRLHTWSLLRIKPVATPEGTHYTFSGFDVIDNSTVCIVGKFNNHNLLKIIKENDVQDIPVPAQPMDVKYFDNNIYVLTHKGITVVNKQKVLKNIPVNDSKLGFYDKMMVFDNHLFLLMSDGSAYQLVKNNLIKQTAPTTATNEKIWIKKTGRNSFELKADPCNNICKKASYNTEIGSITLAGGTANNIFVCVDKYTKSKPARINRIISNSRSGFKKDLLNLPFNTFTYIKNDYKIVNNTLYYVKVSPKGFSIEKKSLQ